MHMVSWENRKAGLGGAASPEDAVCSGLSWLWEDQGEGPARSKGGTLVQNPTLKRRALPESRPQAPGAVLGNAQGRFLGLHQPAASHPFLPQVTFWPGPSELSQPLPTRNTPGGFPGIAAIPRGCFTSLSESAVYLDLRHVRGKMARNASGSL